MSVIAELEIAIGAIVDKQVGYPVVLRLFAAKSDADRRFPATGSAHTPLDANKLKIHRADFPEYDKAMSAAFFADPEIQTGFTEALAIVNAAGGDAQLRVRLFLDTGAEDLHKVRWECLRRENKPLFAGDRILFSRYLASREARPVDGKGALKALVAIASPDTSSQNDPENEGQKLPPVDVASEKKLAMTGLSKLAQTQVDFLADPPDGTVPASLENIDEAMRNGCDILYLACHGGLVSDPDSPEGFRPKLYLDGSTTPVNASRLVNQIRELQRRPRLVILASCQSAGTDKLVRAASGSLISLGPMLADAGVPAVIAMQGNVKMTTVEAFLKAFFRELDKDGMIDRAVGVARAKVAGDPDEPECDDYWMPVLFMRLRTGRIWYTPCISSLLPGAPAEDDKWKLIRDAVFEKGVDGGPSCRCTPVIGPGALEALGGPLQELAETLAEKYSFPMAAYARGELPTVTQYIAINQERPVQAKREFVRLLMVDLARRFPSDAMSKLDPNLLSHAPKITHEAGRQYRRENPQDPYRLLASRPFPIYITVTPDAGLEEALVEAGRRPRSDFSRWNTDPVFDLLNYKKYPTIFDREPKYVPRVEEPLVYHLFGMLEPPGPMEGFVDDPKGPVKEPRDVAGCASIVLTEDDYFQYMLSILSKTGTKEEMPLVVRAALAANALLFFGFRIEDWSFRVLLRGIFSPAGAAARQVGPNSYPSIGAQVQPDETQNTIPSRTASYYSDYFRQCKISTFWGNVHEFAEAFDRNVPGDPVFLANIEASLK